MVINLYECRQHVQISVRIFTEPELLRETEVGKIRVENLAEKVDNSCILHDQLRLSLVKRPSIVYPDGELRISRVSRFDNGQYGFQIENKTSSAIMFRKSEYTTVTVSYLASNSLVAHS